MRINNLNIIKMTKTLLLILTPSLIFGQIITSPNIPSQGITINFDQIDDTVSISSNGPWDFSNINPTSTYDMSMLPIDSSSHASNYPNSTHVLKSDNGEFFFSVSPTQFKTYGKVGLTTVTNYQNPLILINYPLTSTINHSDSIGSTVIWNSLTAPVNDKIEIIGLSSGSVTMPDGNVYNNAIVVSTKRTTINGPDPIFGNYLTVEEISKQFWLQDYPLPVIEVLHAYSNSNIVLKRTLFLKGNMSSNQSEITKNINRKIKHKFNLLGKESNAKNTLLIYLYDDGSVEKRIVLD